MLVSTYFETVRCVHTESAYLANLYVRECLSLCKEELRHVFLLICWPLTSKVAISRWQHCEHFERLRKGLTCNVHTESAYLTNVYVRECLSLCKEELRHVFLLICWPLTSKVAISRGQHCEHFERLRKGLTCNVHTESAYLTNVYVRECLSLCKEELRHVFLLICWPLTSKVAISRGQHCEHFERLRKGLTCNVHTESAYLTNVYVRECLSLCKEELRHVFCLFVGH